MTIAQLRGKIRSFIKHEEAFRVPKELKRYICSHEELLNKTGNLNLSGTVTQLRRNGNGVKG